MISDRIKKMTAKSFVDCLPVYCNSDFMVFAPFVADHGCVCSLPNMMTHMALDLSPICMMSDSEKNCRSSKGTLLTAYKALKTCHFVGPKISHYYHLFLRQRRLKRA